MANPKSVKLSDHLTTLAESEASIEHRSVPKQIEYWSLLGRAMEKHLNKGETHDLLQGKKTIDEVVLVDAFPTGETIMSELEADRADGTLATTVTQAHVKYEAVEGEPSLFRQILPNGSSQVGTVNNGKFVGQDTLSDAT